MKIINTTLAILVLLSLISCSHTNKKAVQSEISLNTKLDSIKVKQGLIDSIVATEPFEEKLFQKAYRDLIESYDKIEIIDSNFVIEKDTFHVTIKYYCLKNTQVVIPKKFLIPHMNSDFSTHDFILKLIVLRNNKSCFDKTYEKRFFYKQMQNENLKKIGVLFCPYIERVNDKIVLGVSITIPLTDIGEGVGDTLSVLNFAYPHGNIIR